MRPSDSLSFYKESLAGEADNYVHLRAAAERKSPTDVLRTLAAEVIDSAQRINALMSVDPELDALWQRFVQVSAATGASRQDFSRCQKTRDRTNALHPPGLP